MSVASIIQYTIGVYPRLFEEIDGKGKEIAKAEIEMMWN